MPYINQDDRTRLTVQGEWNGSPIRTPGELNYLITTTALSGAWDAHSDFVGLIESMISSFYENSYKRYQNHNDVIGALECCRKEFMRRSGFHLDAYNQEVVLKALHELSDSFYGNFTASYEDSCIERNGDVI